MRANRYRPSTTPHATSEPACTAMEPDVDEDTVADDGANKAAALSLKLKMLRM